MFFLIVGLLGAVSPTGAQVGKDNQSLNNKQLHRLFSGSVVKASGDECRSGGGGVVDWDFDLKEDGRLEVIFTCIANYPFEERSSGKWRIEANKLCMEDPDGLISRYARDRRRRSRDNHQDKCWRVKPGTSRFEVYDSDWRKVWEFLVFSPNLPRHYHKQITELKKLGDRLQVVATRTASDASKDSASWEEIKYSNRVSDFQQYLAKFPGGMFVKLAESQMRALITRQADPDAVKDQFVGIDFGTYHALVIGINDYKNLPKLKTAVRDAKAVASMLKKNYGFKVSMLIDPERADIIDALDEYRETLSHKDNLLIYYAGHGWLDEEADEGYWLTRSAKKNRRSRWISNATITNTLKVLPAKHVMVIADSCYSGTLTRSAAIGFRDKDYYRRMASKQARVAMVSGGLEPVADNSGKGNSPFATAFLDALRNNTDVIDGTQLFSEIRRPVILNAKQTPEYSDVRGAGHDGGDFLFVRKK
jgi:hypothetical protein